MNILIPDQWLREYLKTTATPEQMKEYLSLSGPSVERILDEAGQIVYDVEVTTNRPDAMSITGIAREAAVILPRFGVKAEFVNDPYKMMSVPFVKRYDREGQFKLSITTQASLNPRWTSIVLTNVRVGPSPAWLAERLTATGIRPINTIVDITNYLMRAYGQPAHAFDYDAIGKKGDSAVMKLRASKKGEKITTLDGKTHILPGDDIIIEDGAGRIIDLCGIMGGENSSITERTKTIVLFLQTYDPTHIRKTSMKLAHRTEAAGLFEKGVDSELILPALIAGVQLIEDVAGGSVASKLYDLYPDPYVKYRVTANRQKIDRYLGVHLADSEIKGILTKLGFDTTINKTAVTVVPPSFRRDVTIDVDIIEEIARLYGYHRIESRLPDGEPPMALPDPALSWEEELKIRMRDWGYTELYTYSMISEREMDIFGLSKDASYKIANPLSSEWVYMRPSLQPGLLSVIAQNQAITEDLSLFELSKVYHRKPNSIPEEEDILIVARTGEKFFELKGMGEAILALFGITGPYPQVGIPTSWKDPSKCLTFGDYGSVGLVSGSLLTKLDIRKPVTILDLSITKLLSQRKPVGRYVPIPKYPPIVEDLSFIVPEKFAIGPLIEAIKRAHTLISRVTLLDVYEQTRTIRVWYQHPEKNLTSEEIAPIRANLIALATKEFGVKQKAA